MAVEASLKLISCKRDGVTFEIDLPEEMQRPSRIVLHRSVLPDDYEPALYIVTGKISISLIAKKTKVKIAADKAQEKAQKEEEATK